MRTIIINTFEIPDYVLVEQQFNPDWLEPHPVGFEEFGTAHLVTISVRPDPFNWITLQNIPCQTALAAEAMFERKKRDMCAAVILGKSRGELWSFI